MTGIFLQLNCAYTLLNAAFKFCPLYSRPKIPKLLFMTARLYLLTLALICFSFTSYAQKNLKEAIIVSNKSDTIKGFIDYKERYKNPTSILFTSNKNAAATRYTVNELNYFNVSGLEEYERHTVDVSLDKEALSAIGEKDTSHESRAVFLKIVHRGSNVTLFSYRDDLKRRMYILENGDSIPVELRNSVYMVNGQVKEEKQYRNMLTGIASKYLPGDVNIISQINNAGYNASDMEDICLKLNGVTKKEFAKPASAGNQSAIRIFIGGGVNRGSLDITGTSLYSGINSHPFYYPLGIVGADYAFNPSVGKLILRGQLHVTGYKTDAYVFKDFDQYTEEYFFKLEQVNIAFEPQLLYNIYNQKNLKWFISAGVGLNFSSYPLNEQKAYRKSSTNAEVTDENYVKSLQEFWMNACFSSGVDFNRAELSFVYFPKASIAGTATWGIDNSSLQLRLSFYLKK